MIDWQLVGAGNRRVGRVCYPTKLAKAAGVGRVCYPTERDRGRSGVLPDQGKGG